ncbi:hypothetical protein FHEFKHOI_00621 [Candidatus Methanoperedenaceae archaeon GB50]|nr:hypothetical protein AIOGIFDO_00619 [Candidatus Methanoperedenaceae archaeon GB37]CAD7769540.1 hypothetical protein FHEFKHOI_00621 [Candidatus Methanoperedenaceae archaeon GB50]CAD7778559.1 MAG: hypothetical protein KBONHNOK_01168 [Candidatus Methanoperedenaceae archaeon GB50]
MKYAKPHQRDYRRYRRPENAELHHRILDETSPQLDRKHSKRLWPFNKSAVKKNTTKMRANTLGFYAINV